MNNVGFFKLEEFLQTWHEGKQGSQEKDKNLIEIVAETYDCFSSNIVVDTSEKGSHQHLIVRHNQVTIFVKVFENEFSTEELLPLLGEAKKANADGVIVFTFNVYEDNCTAIIQQLDSEDLTLKVITFEDLLAVKDDATLYDLMLVKKSDRPQKTGSENQSQKTVKSLIRKIWGAVVVISTLIALLVFFTGKNFPDYFPSDDFSSSTAISAIQPTPGKTSTLEYSISVAISDTMSTNWEPAKKIVATASADTTNMTLHATGNDYTTDIFNMTRDSERKFSFLAVFDSPGTHTVTITAYREDGEITTKEIIIET